MKLNRKTVVIMCALVLGCAGMKRATASYSEPDQPTRPALKPGENNWIRPAERTASGVGLTTTDLTVLTPADVTAALIGPGVMVSNIVYTGSINSAGIFGGGTGIIGCDSGAILSSGNIAFVPGPNSADDTSQANGLPGDPDLQTLIPGYTVNDAAVLEFDFECGKINVIQFQYVFTSEEYNEWVFTPYNDVFGFFLDGVNIALVPGLGTPVAIDNVNCGNPYNPPAGGNSCNLYINNDLSDGGGAINTQMDGMTMVFTATTPVSPGPHHLKLAIADAGDFVYDSNVFLCAQTLACSLPIGACCDTGTLLCLENVLEADCQGPNFVWSVGLSCAQAECPPTPHCLDDLECEDEDDCTTNFCDPVMGCLNTPIDCDDGNVCTNEACIPASGCEYTAVNIDDGDPCTLDSCDPISGPSHSPIQCPDGQPCDPITGCGGGGGCDADLDGDDLVNASDLAILLGAWGDTTGHDADLDGDDLVNASDLAILLGHWGPCL